VVTHLFLFRFQSVLLRSANPYSGCVTKHLRKCYYKFTVTSAQVIKRCAVVKYIFTPPILNLKLCMRRLNNSGSPCKIFCRQHELISRINPGTVEAPFAWFQGNVSLSRVSFPVPINHYLFLLWKNREIMGHNKRVAGFAT